MDKQRIEQRLLEDFEQVSQNHVVLGVFLKGSQNYGLALKDSDIDTVAVVIPTLDEFARCARPESKTIHLESGEQIVVKDVRDLHHELLLQHPGTLELLFTEYRKLNPEFEHLYQEVFDHAETVAHYNVQLLFERTLGMMYSCRKHLCNQSLEKGWCSKQMYHLLRLSHLLSAYACTSPFEDCLKPADNLLIMAVRRGETSLTADEAQEIANRVIQDSESLRDHYTVIIQALNYSPNTWVEELLFRVQYCLIAHQMEKDLKTLGGPV